MEFDTTTILGIIAAVGAAVAGIVKAGKFFSKFTKTKKDDEFFDKAGEVIDGLPEVPETPAAE